MTNTRDTKNNVYQTSPTIDGQKVYFERPVVVGVKRDGKTVFINQSAIIVEFEGVNGIISELLAKKIFPSISEE